MIYYTSLSLIMRGGACIILQIKGPNGHFSGFWGMFQVFDSTAIFGTWNHDIGNFSGPYSKACVVEAHLCREPLLPLMI